MQANFADSEGSIVTGFMIILLAKPMSIMGGAHKLQFRQLNLLTL